MERALKFPVVLAVLAALVVPGLLLPACGSGAPDTPQEKAKAVVLRLLELSKAGDAAAAAPLVVYRGDDRERKWKDVCDPAREEEVAQVARALREIREYADAGDPEFGEFSSETESEGTWLVWEVTFPGDRKVYFACLETPKGVALGDIDD